MPVDKRKVSLCIPTYNRVEMTIESFSKVYFDDRIDEIVIVDDASEIEKYLALKEICDALPKIHLYRNLTNQDCYTNKMISLTYARNDWAILLDSDNEINKSYLDKIYSYKWQNDTVYTPDFAKPNFDFTAYSGLLISKENVAKHIGKPMLETMLNAANFFVNRHKYGEVWDRMTDPVTSDSIYMMSRWLVAGNKIQVVPGLQYEHRIHDGSHYRTNVHRTPHNFHETILNNLRALK